MRSKRNLRLSLKNAIKKREKQSKNRPTKIPLLNDKFEGKESLETAPLEKNMVETRSASKNLSFGRKNNHNTIVPRNLSNTFSLNESKAKNSQAVSGKSQIVGCPQANYNFPRYYTSHQMIPHIEIAELIRACIKQFDFFLQLSIQNSMLSQNPDIKQRSLKLLSEFFSIKENTVALLELPKFDVNIEFTKVTNKI